RRRVPLRPRRRGVPPPERGPDRREPALAGGGRPYRPGRWTAGSRGTAAGTEVHFAGRTRAGTTHHAVTHPSGCSMSVNLRSNSREAASLGSRMVIKDRVTDEPLGTEDERPVLILAGIDSDQWRKAEL